MYSDYWLIDNPLASPGIEQIRKIAPKAVEQAFARPPMPCREHRPAFDRTCAHCSLAVWRWFAGLLYESTWSFGHALNAAEAGNIRLGRWVRELGAELVELRQQQRIQRNEQTEALIARLEAERDEWRARAIAAEQAIGSPASETTSVVGGSYD